MAPAGLALAGLVVLGLLGVGPWAAPAAAQPPDAPLRAERVRVRVTLSKDAAEHLRELRVRRLVKAELGDEAEVESGTTGPLGGDLIWVWIDLRDPRTATLEVRRVDRPLARRTLAIGGFPADVAAEAVAIAASEMVRVQARVRPAPKPVASNNGPRNKGEVTSFAVGAAAAAVVLPESEPLLVAGPELGLSITHGTLGLGLYGGWLVGVGEPRARWLEAGAAFDFRVTLEPSWRLRLGARVGVVDVQFREAVTIDGELEHNAWTIRPAAVVGVEGRIDPGTWLFFSAEPGATIRTLSVIDREGDATELGGFALGFHLGLLAEALSRRD